MASEMHRKYSFAPIVDENVRILILGSLPGEMSLSHGQYYANPKNQFWSLMAKVIGVDLKMLPYEIRLKILKDHGIGLWDVVADAHREGSLDSKIRNHSHNDLIGLINDLPLLSSIAFNGGTAAKLGLKALGDHANQYRIIKLPSSSPAYTLPYAEKLEVWLSMRDLVNF